MDSVNEPGQVEDMEKVLVVCREGLRISLSKLESLSRLESLVRKYPVIVTAGCIYSLD